MNLSGSPLDYLVVFFGGILLSFTPCVYPLLPVSVGYITVRSGGSKAKGFILSLVYTSGIAITYSLLGLLASLSGEIFGQIASRPLTHIIVGAIIVLFGVSMLEIISWPLSSGIKYFPQKKEGYLATFLLGLSSGLTISACVTPVLGAILAYLATKKNIFYGTTLLFVFAYGMGAIFILAGTFGSLLAGLPKSGKWMLYLKKISAFILILMGGYFIYSAF